MNEPQWDPARGDYPWSRAPFLPGLELSRRYYQEAVAPILQKHFPTLGHSAGLIGYGSDVIGFDDARSRDHAWGPRMLLFLAEEGFDKTRADVDGCLRQELPVSFLGYSTNFDAPDPNDNGVRGLEPVEHGPVNHMIRITPIPAFFDEEIGWDINQPLSAADWLSFSEHRLLSVTAGGVWQDDLGLEGVRSCLMYYPHPVWMYLLACQWARIGQEEPFVGRTAEAGDDTGSRILAAKLVQIVMGLGFLLEGRYAPYSKWFGTGFKRLSISAQLQPVLDAALAAPDFRSREAALSAAYEICAQRFNTLGLIAPVPEQVSWFHGRPFKVIHGGEIGDALLAAIDDEEIRKIPGVIGSVNQFASSTDLLESLEVSRRLKVLYR